MVTTDKNPSVDKVPEGESRASDLPAFLGKPFVGAVLLYQLGVVLALLPVFEGDWTAALKRLALVTASVGLFFVIVLFFNRPTRLKWLAVGLVGLVALVALFGTAEVKTDTLRLNSLNYQVYTLLRKFLAFKGLPQVNQNVLGNFLIAFLPLALAFVVWGRGWLWRLYFGSCTLLIGVAVVATASRSALMGLVALFFIFALFLSAGRPRLTGVVIVSLVLAGIGGLIYILAAGFTNIESGASRWELWRTVLGLIGDYPLTGGGLGQFDKWFLNYATPGIYAYPQPHAHDIFLQSWAEFGLAGLLAVVLTLVTAVRLLVKYRALSRVEPALRPVVAGSLSGVIVLFVSCLLEYGAWGGKFAPAFWILPGMLAASRVALDPVKLPAFARLNSPSGSGSNRTRWLLAGGLGLVLLALLIPPVLINTARIVDSTSVSPALYQAAAPLAFWNPVPLRNSGKLAERQANPAGAETLYKQALQRDPGDWLTLIPLANLLENTGAHDQALAYWRQAGAAPYFIQLARNELQQNPPAYTPAEKYVKLALAIDPHYDEAIQFLVGVYMGTERKEAAATFLASIVEQNPNDPILLHEAAVWAPTDEQKVGFLEKALQLDNSNALYYWELGKAYQGVQQFDQAKKAYQQSLNLKPTYQDPVRSLSALYLEQNQPAEVVKLLEKFIGNNLFVEKPDPEYVLLAQAYLALNNNSASLAASQKALSYNAANPQAYLVEAGALNSSGEKDKAREAYMKVLQLDPGNQQAQQALAALT